MWRSVLCAIIAFTPGGTAPARADAPIAVLERRPLAVAVETSTRPTHRLSVTLAYFEDAWRADAIASALRESARILAQCGVAVESAELVRLDAPPRFRDFDTPASRELARTLRLPGPTVYFVAGTRQSPAFEAEAVGRANSGTRPELADSVWVTRGARDPGIVLAHELAHVLMDSGTHSGKPGNLMREDTTPRNTRLDAAQCARLRETATANGLLKPLAPGFR
ncbi:MAG: hypothetical protein AB7S87_17375 [Burkholderiales bacterium]